jgi:hypothetical protein
VASGRLVAMTRSTTACGQNRGSHQCRGVSLTVKKGMWYPPFPLFSSAQTHHSTLHPSDNQTVRHSFRAAQILDDNDGQTLKEGRKEVVVDERLHHEPWWKRYSSHSRCVRTFVCRISSSSSPSPNNNNNNNNNASSCPR